MGAELLRIALIEAITAHVFPSGFFDEVIVYETLVWLDGRSNLILHNARRADAMSVKTRELYSSPNGDRWLLCLDANTERVFIRHEANRPSGGQVSELDIGTFLSRGPLNPEHQALLRLVAALVDDGAETSTAKGGNAAF